jgi:hypothetical protein
MLMLPVLSLHVLVVIRIGSSYQQVQKMEEKKHGSGIYDSTVLQCPILQTKVQSVPLDNNTA